MVVEIMGLLFVILGSMLLSRGWDYNEGVISSVGTLLICLGAALIIGVKG